MRGHSSVRLPKGMTMEQLKKLRKEDTLKIATRGRAPVRYRCSECGMLLPCRHTTNDR